MPPKAPKVVEQDNLGHGITFEVRPASKGSPTVHVIVDGCRLPAFRRDAKLSAAEQVRKLPAVRSRLHAVASATREAVNGDDAPMQDAEQPPARSRELHRIDEACIVQERTRSADERQPKQPRLPTYEPGRLRSQATGSRWMPAAVEEAQRAEPELNAELEALLRRVLATREGEVEVAPWSDAASELVGGAMERTAAIMAHAALLEQLALAKPNAEHTHIWADAAPPTVLSTPARMVDFSEAWGTLTIEPPLLKFSAALTEETCGTIDSAWPLASFAGRELRAALGNVARLLAHDKSQQAKQALAAIDRGPDAKAGLAKVRAGELRSLLFTFGGYNLTQAALERFLRMPEVKRLMDRDLLKSRQELTDAKTATEMLQAAKRYFNEMLKTTGRRSDAERNAFWAGVVTLMPADLIDNRQGRAMMRILDLPYRTIKRGNTMRKELEDQGKGWILLTTKPHSDRAALHLDIIVDWWHSDEISCPDNQNKEQVRVYRGHGIDPQTGRRGYELHWRRAQEGNDKHALSVWHASEAAKKFAAATATAKRPGGIKVGRKLLVECRCECVKKRDASFADCKICSFVIEGLKNWHKHRHGWRQAKPGCACQICSDPQKASKYRDFSRSVSHVRATLLPCGQTAYSNYSVSGGPTFKAFAGLCSAGRCPQKRFGRPSPDACGWANVFGNDCPIEASDDAHEWERWEPKLRSENAEGKKFYSDEWVPHKGTRKEFIKELRTAISESYLFHIWRHQIIRHAIKLHESRKDGLTATEWSDYAAVLDLTRSKTVTCGVPERINELVTVMGYKPHDVTVEVPKSRRHAATTKVVRKQHVDVFFAFHPSGYKADARSYNVAQEDIDSFLKYGKVKHGEWFLECQRLPGGDHSKPLPDDFSERPEQPADFPEYERKLSVTDGCAGQFDGKDNYHQTAEWFTKFGILRIHWILEAMEGKSICDALGNLPKNAITDAIEKGQYIFSGSREFVLYLARHHPTPSVAKVKKEGWWAVERIFYGFFEHSKFTKLVVPTADGFQGSHDMHMIAGVCKDPAAARSEGRLMVAAVPCACVACTELRFHDCKMKALFGQREARAVKTPRAATDTANLRQMDSLSEFAASLKSRQLVGVRVTADKKERSIEGPYWLALLKGKAYEATEAVLHSTDRIERGWLVVKGQWLKLEEKSGEGGRRSYTLLDAEVLLVVNTLVRLDGLQFDAAKGGPAGRELRAPKGTEAAGKLYYISQETHHALLACSDG